MIKTAEISTDLKNRIWTGRYFGPRGALTIYVPELSSRVSSGDVHALSALSSLYYSAAGNAFTRWKKNRFQFWWLWRAKRLFDHSLSVSNQLESQVGLSKMSPDELDVRQSILRKARRFEGALRCIEEALDRENIPTHTEGLLFVGYAECLFAQGKHNVDLVIMNALMLGRKCSESNPKQASRIIRGCSDSWRKLGHLQVAQELLKEARELAERSGATDQIVKIERLA